MSTRRMAATALVLILLGCRGEPPSAAEIAAAKQERPALDQIELQIQTDAATHPFTVEVARTPDEQARGLMFRESLAPNVGMLFPFPEPRPASFWMKNTLIPLDMIFVRPDGTIARIAVNTTPLSLAPVGVGEPVAAVLEIAGGRSVELGIDEGDRVSWPGGPSF
ncbi:DUF192 domain-containing protein [Sphingosinicella humi]|nr:DUF192 domain-containing protein [Sphingosinicella humi]